MKTFNHGILNFSLVWRSLEKTDKKGIASGIKKMAIEKSASKTIYAAVRNMAPDGISNGFVKPS